MYLYPHSLNIIIIFFFLKTNDFTKQKRHLDEKLARKESELDIVRHELNQIKDFRKKKGQMQKELDEVIYFFLRLFFF
jgi:hypothetical protein